MKLRNDLPDGCPPPDSEPIVEVRRLYRLVAQFPPKGDDFRANWELYSRHHDTWRLNGEECKAKGLTLFTTPEAAKSRTTLENQKGKRVCEVLLLPGSGTLSKEKTRHVTWWPCRIPCLLAICVEYEI